MITFVPARSLRAIAAAALTLGVAACATSAEPSAPAASSAAPGPTSAAGGPTPSASEATYRIGLSNTVKDDGWRQAMVCSAKAQAGASGRVRQVTLADRNTDAAGQAADIRNLVAIGVDAIVLYPSDPTAIAGAIGEAIDAGVAVVGIGRPMDLEAVTSIATDQEAFGYASATWLFEALGGKGDVVVFRGVTGDAIDAERDAGLKRAAAAYPDIKIVSETQTEGDPAVAVQQLNAFIATEKDIDGIWAPGVDSVIVDALKAAEQPLVPIVGADHGSFVSQLLEQEGLVGAAVTDTPAVGGAAVTRTLEVLDGTAPAEPLVSIAPTVWANDTDAGRAALVAASDPDIELAWPLSVTLPGATTYTIEDLVACADPGR